MSTTGTAVAEDTSQKRSGEERATALGPGIIRLPGGAYVSPQSAQILARCLGPLAFLKTSASFSVNGELDGDEPLLFLYPLPAEASLVRVAIGGEQLLPGSLEVKSLTDLPESAERPEAPDALYEEFGAETTPVFSLQLESWKEHLAGGGTFEIELEYATGLPTIDGRICLSCPTQVSPHLGAETVPQIQVGVVIEDGNELVDEPSSNFPLESETGAESVTLTGTLENVTENLEVTFRPGRTQMPVTRLRRSGEHFIFSIFPPTSIPASPQRRDIVFAIDASENLDQDAYNIVKADICQALRTLDENDRFALVTFGRDIDGYDGGEFCDIEKVEEACEWLESTRPQGRADVQPLLQRIQSLPSQEERQLCIFLLAGGHVGNEPAILKSLDFDQSDRRYYTIGLGPTAKQSFLRRLALLTRGRCEVSVDGGCSDALSRLLGQTRALLAEVTFEEQSGSADVDNDSLVPSKMTSLTPQGPVHCLGCGAPSALRFRSKDETGVFFAGTVNAQPTDNPALAGVWAGLRVRELLDSVKLTTGAKRKSLKSEASGLAADHGILTEDTVLVLQTGDGVEIQYSAQPAKWRAAEPKVKKGNVSNKDSATPFDWRKGLVAREGLFKGSKPGSSGDSSESGGRYGLRAKKGASTETTGKPRLDRAVVGSLSSASADDEELGAEIEDAVSEEQLQETPPVEDAGVEAPQSQPSSTVSNPVPVPSSQPPVFHLHADPLAEGKLRFDSYRQQMGSLDTEIALAALQGLPETVSPRGGELPRILAQTVAHLEKRGFFSHAVSVLGLLLRDNPTPEVTKKMESLIAAWADSLGDDQLPEAIQVLHLGQRVCRGSEALAGRCEELWDKWKEVSDAQGELPEVVANDLEVPEEAGPLLSEHQRELARLKQQQASLAQQLGDLQKAVQEQLGALPQMLENLADKVASQTAEAVAASQPKVVVQQQPAPLPEIPTPSATSVAAQPEPAPTPEAAAATEPELAPLPEIPTPEPAPLPEIPTPEPVAEAVVDSAVEEEEAPVQVEDEAPEALGVEPEIAVEPEPEPEPEPVVEPEPIVEPEPEPEPEPEEEPGMVLTREELTELLLQDARSDSSRKAVEASLAEPKERINFFRDLVKADKKEPYHSLSLARAYREADQTKVAVVHYQKYLRSEKDPQAYLELADAYDELGKANLSASARKAAEAYG